MACLVEEGDEWVPVLGLVVGAVDEDEVVFGHGCGVLSFPGSSVFFGCCKVSRVVK